MTDSFEDFLLGKLICLVYDIKLFDARFFFLGALKLNRSLNSYIFFYNIMKILLLSSHSDAQFFQMFLI